MAEKNDETEVKSAAVMRKINKPLMERKRRERINNSLDQLKSILMDVTNKDNSQYSKLEKADILEMAVNHLQNMNIPTTTTPKTEREISETYTAGYNHCIIEVLNYLKQFQNLDKSIEMRFLNHMSNLQKKSLNTNNNFPAFQRNNPAVHSSLSSPLNFRNTNNPALNPNLCNYNMSPSYDRNMCLTMNLPQNTSLIKTLNAQSNPPITKHLHEPLQLMPARLPNGLDVFIVAKDFSNDLVSSSKTSNYFIKHESHNHSQFSENDKCDSTFSSVFQTFQNTIANDLIFEQKLPMFSNQSQKSSGLLVNQGTSPFYTNIDNSKFEQSPNYSNTKEQSQQKCLESSGSTNSFHFQKFNNKSEFLLEQDNISNNNQIRESDSLLLHDMLKPNVKNFRNRMKSSCDKAHFKEHDTTKTSSVRSANDNKTSDGDKKQSTSSFFIQDKKLSNGLAVAIVQPLSHRKHANKEIQEEILKENSKSNVPLDLSMKISDKSMNYDEDEYSSSDEDQLSINDYISDEEDDEAMWRPW